VFYVLVFGLLAVLLVFAFFATRSRRRREMASEEGYGAQPGTQHTSHDDGRRSTKAKRAQSRQDRRKRH